MKPNAMELTLNELELVNGGFDWLDHLGGLFVGMTGGAATGFSVGMVGGPAGMVTGLVVGTTVGGVVGGAMGYENIKKAFQDE